MSKHFVVYTKTGCPSCVKAKELIKKRGDTFSENTIGVDIQRDEFVEMFPHIKSVPYIVEDGKAIGGYEKLVEWYSER